MKLLTRPVLTLALLFGALPWSFASADDYMFCTLHPATGVGAHRQYYYTAIFQGYYTFKAEYNAGFKDYLEESQEGADNVLWSDGLCFVEDTRAAAQRELKRRKSSNERLNIKVVQTNWAPDTDTFTSKPLEDFNITVSKDDRSVEVCVRDHECADGDKVRVTVNSRRIFSGEIDHGWDCAKVRVTKGRNRIKMYAVNGTGYKGNCNHENVNTGEIRVRARNSETQSWRHRGGAGSSADIIVETR